MENRRADQAFSQGRWAPRDGPGHNWIIGSIKDGISVESVVDTAVKIEKKIQDTIQPKSEKFERKVQNRFGEKVI